MSFQQAKTPRLIVGRRRHKIVVATVCSWLVMAAFGQAAAPDPELSATTPRSWVEAAANNEIRIVDDDGSFPLRYRIRKVDAKNDVMRDVIESRQGTVARLIQSHGRPLSPAEDSAERDRLNSLLRSPSEFAKHHKRDNAARSYSMQLVHTMPTAMLFTYAPGQPQFPSPYAKEVVIDFAPDPKFRPPNMISGLLLGIAGRMWIDRASKRVLRIEGRVLQPVDFGWGMLARIYPGGTVEFEQTNAGGDRWAYSHLRTNLTIREVLVKVAQQRSTMDAANFELLPAPVDYQEAIRILLATPLPN